jgi:hypothetical protein
MGGIPVWHAETLGVIVLEGRFVCEHEIAAKARLPKRPRRRRMQRTSGPGRDEDERERDRRRRERILRATSSAEADTSMAACTAGCTSSSRIGSWGDSLDDTTEPRRRCAARLGSCRQCLYANPYFRVDKHG